MAWTSPALPPFEPLLPLDPTSLARETEQRRSYPQGVTVTGSESLTLGQTLVWNRPPWIEPDAPQHFEVLFEDPHLLAVNKPRGLPTLPSGGLPKNPLLRLVQKQTPTQTLSTGWAEPPLASSSSPKHRRPHLIYPEAG